LANLTLSQYFVGEEKNICMYSLRPDHLEAKQNNRKVKRSKIEKKGVKKREL